MVLLSVLCVYLIIQLLVLAVLVANKDKKANPPSLPMVSVWVAARNEAHQISNCLDSLAKLNYPLDKLEILVGNDHSGDNTAEVVREFIDGKVQFKLIEIGENLGKARGKANVLAQLAHRSKGDIYALADADVQVNSEWLNELVAAFDKKTGIVSATTVIRKDSLFAEMQSIDWLFFMGLIKATSDIGMSCTAVGNNMAISKDAYWSTGGYEQIDFSITEDYKLFSEVIRRNWGFAHLLTRDSTNVSSPAPDFTTLMKQRKRWLTGGKELPWYWKLMLGIFGIFFPLTIVLFFLDWRLALFAWILRIIIQCALIMILARKVGMRYGLHKIILYEFYSVFLSLIVPFYLLLPGGKTWKGRKF